MTEFVISVLLTVAPSLYWQVESWVMRTPETPGSDVVVLCFPHAVAKNHKLGPTAPTEVVDLDACWWGKKRYDSDWVYYNGKRRGSEYHDVDKTAVAGTWLIIRDKQGKYIAFDMAAGSDPYRQYSSLDRVNSDLARHGVGPVSDADFRTFEELAEERERRKVTWYGTTLALIALGWAVVLVAVMWRRR